jgi:acyl carrier protein
MKREDAINWIATLFEERADTLTPDTHRDSIPAWDSLGVLTLMASLDSEYGVALTDDEIQQIKTVGDILAIMQRAGKLD